VNYESRGISSSWVFHGSASHRTSEGGVLRPTQDRLGSRRCGASRPRVRCGELARILRCSRGPLRLTRAPSSRSSSVESGRRARSSPTVRAAGGLTIGGALGKWALESDRGWHCCFLGHLGPVPRATAGAHRWLRVSPEPRDEQALVAGATKTTCRITASVSCGVANLRPIESAIRCIDAGAAIQAPSLRRAAFDQVGVVRNRPEIAVSNFFSGERKVGGDAVQLVKRGTRGRPSHDQGKRKRKGGLYA
jgi:hypothetical protein